MKDRNLAARYARALLEALPDAATVETADAFLTAFATTVESTDSLRDVLMNPAVGREPRKRVLSAVADAHGLPRLVKNFLLLLADNGRFDALPSIAAVFHEERERRSGVVPAKVTAAAPLDDALRGRLSASLERLTGKKVRLEVDVDPALVGGAVAQVGSMVYDGTLRTQIQRLRRDMAEE